MSLLRWGSFGWWLQVFLGAVCRGSPGGRWVCWCCWRRAVGAKWICTSAPTDKECTHAPEPLRPDIILTWAAKSDSSKTFWSSNFETQMGGGGGPLVACVCFVCFWISAFFFLVGWYRWLLAGCLFWEVLETGKYWKVSRLYTMVKASRRGSSVTWCGRNVCKSCEWRMGVPYLLGTRLGMASLIGKRPGKVILEWQWHFPSSSEEV